MLVFLITGSLVLFTIPPRAFAAGGPTYNVKNYGAVGNGTQDDTNAVQAAINALDPNVGGTVYVPSGTYLIRYNAQGDNASLKLKSNMTFQMDPGAQIKLMASSSGAYSMLFLANIHDVTVTGGTITGDRATHTGTGGEQGHGISMWNSRNITIDGVTTRDCWGDGMYEGGNSITYSQNLTVQNCTSTNNRRQGISIESVDGGTITNNHFTNTNGTSPESGIDLEPSYAANGVRNLTISGNTCTGNHGMGIVGSGSMAPVTADTITGNTIESNNISGIGFDESSGLTISGNTIRSNTVSGISLHGCSGFNVHDNQVLSNGDNGIVLTEDWAGRHIHTNNCHIEHNTSTGNNGFGIRLLNGSYSNTIINNALTPNAAGSIGVWAAGTGNITAPNNWAVAPQESNTLPTSGANEDSVDLTDTGVSSAQGTALDTFLAAVPTFFFFLALFLAIQ
jgi:parallel beta-helix repeat protein